MKPMSTTGKSKLAMIPEEYSEKTGYVLPMITKLIEVMIANSMMPIAGGSFRYRLLIKENSAERTMRIENVKYKSIDRANEFSRY